MLSPADTAVADAVRLKESLGSAASLGTTMMRLTASPLKSM